MMSLREALEYFIIANLMSIEVGEGYAAYMQCSGFLSKEMFKNKQLRWVYGIICEMYEEGWKSTCEADIFAYLRDKEKVPTGKIGNICCFLIEVYLQYSNMTRPVSSVRWTIGEAVDELLKKNDEDYEDKIKNIA